MAGASNLSRIVITGVGTVAPIGVGKDAFWKSLASGQSGIGHLHAVPPEGFPSKLAAEVHDFDPSLIYCRKALKVMSRDTALGVAAASLAMKDAGLGQGFIDPERLGVSYGCGRISSTPDDLSEAASSSLNDKHRFAFERFGEEALDKIAPLWFIKKLPNMPACHISIEHDARGPNNTLTSRDASGLQALAEGINVIQRDAADVMIVGACSSNIHPVDITKFHLFESLSRREDDPQAACRPFDVTRDGTVVGEGGAAFVIESLDHALRRGAPIYAEVLAVGQGCDGTGWHNGSGGRGVARAVQAALRKAGIEPREIGHINAHGKSTQRDDLVEARGYHWGMGEAARRIPVTAMKSYFGNCDAGAGAVELAGSVLALQHKMLPRTLNYRIPDPRCQLNVVHDDPLELRNLTAMSVNRTSIGQSVAAIIRAI